MRVSQQSQLKMYVGQLQFLSIHTLLTIGYKPLTSHCTNKPYFYEGTPPLE